MRHNDRVFPYTISKDGDVPTLRKVLKQYLPDDMKWVHPHTFHHSYAVYVLKNGMNIRPLQKILGHDILETTAVYLDLLDQDIKDGHKKIQW